MMAHFRNDMPTADEFWEVAAQVALVRGGLVVGFAGDARQPEMGSTLDNVLGFAPQGSAAIMGTSDWRDWTEQAEAFYRLRPAWGRGKAGDANYKYYRVQLADSDGTGMSRSVIDPAPSFSGRLSITSLSIPSKNTSSLNMPSLSGYAATAAGFKGVTFWPRLLARLIDFAFFYIVGSTTGILFGVLLAVASSGPVPLAVLHRLSQTHVPLFMAGVLGSFAYFVICETVHGSTLGKLALSMQVVQQDGSPCRLKSAVIRELGYFVDTMFFGIIGYVGMKGDPEHQRYGDQWADTIVCKRSDVPLESRQDGARFVLALMLGVFVYMAFLMVGLLIQMNL
jgi:uncharacterized RDD family membrane protein YckC